MSLERNKHGFQMSLLQHRESSQIQKRRFSWIWLGFIRYLITMLFSTLLATLRNSRMQKRSSSMQRLWYQAWLIITLKITGTLLFCFYLYHNAYWLSIGKVPPSIAIQYLGIPCPTTGCTRSLISLYNFDLLKSLCYNPLTIPYIALLCCSLLIVAVKAKNNQSILLPRFIGIIWLLCLSLGWASKFILGQRYW